MRDGLDITFNDKQFKDALHALTGKEYKKMVRQALGAAGRILVAKAKKNLRLVTNAAKSKRTNIKNRWNLKKKNGIVVGVRSLEEGVRQKLHLENMNDANVLVNIMKDYRLKWFEKGTKERMAGQPHGIKRKVMKKLGMNISGKISRGKFLEASSTKPSNKGKSVVNRGGATYFFKKAQDATRKEIGDKMQQIIDKNMEIIWYKNQ